MLLGAALFSFVHLAFIGLSAFVGAGLVFAGITDTCGMGMMLGPDAVESSQRRPGQLLCDEGGSLMKLLIITPAR